MKKGCIVLLGIGGVLFVLVFIVLVLADRRLDFMRNAPAFAHDALLKPTTRIRMVLKPGLATTQIAELFPNRKVPAWSLGLILPYEIAVLGDPDLGAGDVGIEVYVNAQRLGPVIRERANLTNFAVRAPNIYWSPAEMTEEGRGRLFLRGTAEIPTNTLNSIRETWRTVTGLTPLPWDGTHLLEVVLDNRDGGGVAAFAALQQGAARERNLLEDKNTQDLVKGIDSLHATADMADRNSAKVEIELASNPVVNQVFILKILLDGIVNQLNGYNLKPYGAQLTGSSVIEGDKVLGHYTLTNVDKLLTAFAGQRAPAQ